MNILSWILFAFFILSAITVIPSGGVFCFIVLAILSMPIKPVQRLWQKITGKRKWVKCLALIVLFIVACQCSSSVTSKNAALSAETGDSKDVTEADAIKTNKKEDNENSCEDSGTSTSITDDRLSIKADQTSNDIKEEGGNDPESIQPVTKENFKTGSSNPSSVFKTANSKSRERINTSRSLRENEKSETKQHVTIDSSQKDNSGNKKSSSNYNGSKETKESINTYDPKISQLINDYNEIADKKITQSQVSPGESSADVIVYLDKIYIRIYDSAPGMYVDYYYTGDINSAGVDTVFKNFTVALGGDFSDDDFSEFIDRINNPQRDKYGYYECPIKCNLGGIDCEYYMAVSPTATRAIKTGPGQ